MVYKNYAKTTLSPTHEARARPFQKRGIINITARIASVSRILISLKHSSSLNHNVHIVQEVIQLRGSSPCLVLYADERILRTSRNSVADKGNADLYLASNVQLRSMLCDTVGLSQRRPCPQINTGGTDIS